MGIRQHYLNTWRLIFKDKGAMLLFFVAGLIYSFFYPLPYQLGQVEAVPTIWVDLDQSSSSRAFKRLLKASPQLRLISASSQTSKTLLPQKTDAIQQALWRGDAIAFIYIPKGFHRSILKNEAAEVQIASHGGYLYASSQVLTHANQAALTLGAAIQINQLQMQGVNSTEALHGVQPIELHTRTLFNPQQSYGHAIVPAVMVLIIQQTLFIGVTLLLGYQREKEQLAVGIKAYLGMLLAFSSIGFLNCLYFFSVALRIQHYAHLSAWGALFVFSLLFSLTIAAFALLLARLFKHREQGLQLLLVTSIPMLFISGYSWPIESLPWLVQKIRWLIPSTAGIHGFVSLNQLGTSLLDIWQEVAALSLLSLLFIGHGLYLYHSAESNKNTASGGA